MFTLTVSPAVKPEPPIFTLETWLTELPSSKPKLAGESPSTLASYQTDTFLPSGASSVKPLPLSLATMPWVPLYVLIAFTRLMRRSAGVSSFLNSTLICVPLRYKDWIPTGSFTALVPFGAASQVPNWVEPVVVELPLSTTGLAIARTPVSGVCVLMALAIAMALAAGLLLLAI